MLRMRFQQVQLILLWTSSCSVEAELQVANKVHLDLVGGAIAQPARHVAQYGARQDSAARPIPQSSKFLETGHKGHASTMLGQIALGMEEPESSKKDDLPEHLYGDPDADNYMAYFTGGSLLLYTALLCGLGCFCCLNASGDNSQPMGTGLGLCWLAIILLIVIWFSTSFAKNWELEWNTALVYGVIATILFCFLCPGAAASTTFVAQIATAPLTRPVEGKDSNQSQQIWGALLDAFRARGVAEVTRGRITEEEIEDVEPKVLIALPSLVFLECVLNSTKGEKKSGGVWLPDGTEVSRNMDMQGFHPGMPNLFQKLIAAKDFVRELGDLQEEEIEYLEMRALDNRPERVARSNTQREVKLNRAASKIAAAATIVTQMDLFSGMREVFDEIKLNVKH